MAEGLLRLVPGSEVDEVRMEAEPGDTSVLSPAGRVQKIAEMTRKVSQRVTPTLAMPPKESWQMPRTGIIAVFAIQALCAFVFVYDIVLDVLGIRTRPISWTVHELIQIGAMFGLVLGVVLGGTLLRRSLGRAEAAEARLAQMSGAFHDLMETRFSEWGLTPAERDVALFVMKGQSIKEIAGLRETSQGTVKAQSAAIYRKAGVKSRAELLGLFIEDLMGVD